MSPLNKQQQWSANWSNHMSKSKIKSKDHSFPILGWTQTVTGAGGAGLHQGNNIHRITSCSEIHFVAVMQYIELNYRALIFEKLRNVGLKILSIVYRPLKQLTCYV